MYQLIVFDWDGTLMDSALKIANCLRAAAKDVNLDVPSLERAKSVIGLGLYECMQRLFPQASESDKHAVIARFKYYYLTGDTTQQALFDGVNEGLRKLDAAGVMLAIATGKSRIGLNRALNETGIENCFVTTRCADETRSKPHPQMLLEILDFTAIDAKDAIMVGDTSFDLDMASNAGMSGLGVSYGVHCEKTLRDCRAVSVQDSVDNMMNWLLDGQITKAYA